MNTRIKKIVIGSVAAALALTSACGTGDVAGNPGTAAGASTGGAVTTVTKTVNNTVTSTAAPSTVTKTITSTATPTTTPKPSSTTPAGLAVGGPGITASNKDGAAEITVVSVRRMTEGTGDYGDAPKNGNYLLVEVSYLCTEGVFDYNQFDWGLRDSEGRTYDSFGSYSSGYDEPDLNSGTLANGSTARGVIIFDGPASDVQVEYTLGYGSAPATWEVPA